MRLIELQIERPTSDKNFPRSIMPQIRKGDIDDSPFNYNKENIVNELSKLIKVADGDQSILKNTIKKLKTNIKL